MKQALRTKPKTQSVIVLLQGLLSYSAAHTDDRMVIHTIYKESVTKWQDDILVIVQTSFLHM